MRAHVRQRRPFVRMPAHVGVEACAVMRRHGAPSCDGKEGCLVVEGLQEHVRIACSAIDRKSSMTCSSFPIDREVQHEPDSAPL